MKNTTVSSHTKIVRRLGIICIIFLVLNVEYYGVKQQVAVHRKIKIVRLLDIFRKTGPLSRVQNYKVQIGFLVQLISNYHTIFPALSFEHVPSPFYVSLITNSDNSYNGEQ